MVGIFILPPSVDALRERLERRAEDDPQTIARRLANARAEITHWNEYQYIVVNHDVDESVGKVLAILKAERERRQRQLGLDGDIRQLLDDLKTMG